MATEFTLPSLGENVQAGDVLHVLVKAGDAVEMDQPVLELETDKATIEVPSSVAGTVKALKVAEGDTIRVGQVVFTVEDGADAPADGQTSAPAGTVEQKAADAVANQDEGLSGGTGRNAAAPAPQGDVERKAEDAVADQEEGLGADGATSVAASASRRTSASAVPASADKSPTATPESGAATPQSETAGSGGRVEVTLPSLGENVTGADVLHVLVKVGDTVAEEQAILELETDKATVEVPSPSAGTVREIAVKDGDTITVGQLVLVLEGAADGRTSASAVPASADKSPAATTTAADGRDASPRRPTATPETAPEVKAEAGQPVAPVADGRTSPAATPASAPDSRSAIRDSRSADAKGAGTGAVAPPRPNVPAAPSVRRLARELGLDIGEVPGSGPGGRISEADVRAHAKNVITGKAAGPASAGGGAGFAFEPLPDFAAYGATERKPMRGIRRKTAEHTLAAWHTIPHVTQCEKADVTDLEALRARFSTRVEQGGGKLTVTSIITKVIATGLRRFPQFNTSVDLAAEEVVYKQYVNVGIAVDTERGLLVPVIRDADAKSITQISSEIAQLADKARTGKLSMDEMSGGCITITNLGGIGGTYFTPIVNHPEVAILGLSRSAMEPVWRNEQFEPRLLLPLSLSYDHRIIDGADAMRFLRFVAEALEQPFVLAL